MIAAKVDDRRSFMNKLLNSECFDEFLLADAMLQTYNTFSIDGHVRREFYGEEAENHPESFSSWKDIRPLCFQLIRGKHTPLSFRFVLQCKPEEVDRILAQNEIKLSAEDIAAFVLTIRFQENTVQLVTGASPRTFLMDKSYEAAWDREIREFLTKHEIDITEE